MSLGTWLRRRRHRQSRLARQPQARRCRPQLEALENRTLLTVQGVGPVVAAAIFCSRALYDLIKADNEDPLLCLITDVTIADPRVQRLKQNVIARGPIVNWTAVAPSTIRWS